MEKIDIAIVLGAVFFAWNLAVLAGGLVLGRWMARDEAYMRALHDLGAHALQCVTPTQNAMISGLDARQGKL